VATQINPKLFSRWMRTHEPAGEVRLSEFACGCGASCDEHSFRCVLGGLERRILICSRCGTVADGEIDHPPLALVFPPREDRGAQPLLGVLSRMQFGAGDMLLAAALTPVPGAEAGLAIQSLVERGPGSGIYDVEFSFDPARSAASQQAYLFTCYELAFGMACAWTELGRAPGFRAADVEQLLASHRRPAERACPSAASKPY
jgi:hypothetical protein